MQENSLIDNDTFDYLKPDKPKAGRFYLLHKICKVNNHRRPIASVNGHPTEKISEYVDFHLRPHVEAVRCRSLFVLLSFFFWPLCCLFFFNIRILITPLVSSTFS